MEQHDLLTVPEKGRDTPKERKWGQERRLEFIDFRLRWEGQLNRSHLTDFFQISVPQASLDIARYGDLAPQNLRYDRGMRMYEAESQFSPVFTTSRPQRYLAELQALSNGDMSPNESFIGWQPPVDAVALPRREVEVQVLTALLQAIKSKCALEIVYQSMSSPEPTARTISPHALAQDGFRWHARAYCHRRRAFRDFVLGRIYEVGALDSEPKVPNEDHEWNRMLDLVLVPHPDLSEAKKRAIEVDYCMTAGEVRLNCRHALLFYTLKRLGLDRNGPVGPERQQIVLKNEDELAPYLTGTTAT